MSIDLGDLIDFLRAEVDVPGVDSFTAAVEDDWLIQLQSAFWETVLDGIVSGYDELEGIVTPVSGSTELSRELQQLVVMYAGIRVVTNKLLNIQSLFRAKAGPVEYETQQAATVLKSVLDELVRRRSLILMRLSDISTTSTYYIDALGARTASIAYGDVSWFGH